MSAYSAQSRHRFAHYFRSYHSRGGTHRYRRRRSNGRRAEIEALRAAPGVQDLPIAHRFNFKRNYKQRGTTVDVGGVQIGGD